MSARWYYLGSEDRYGRLTARVTTKAMMEGVVGYATAELHDAA